MPITRTSPRWQRVYIDGRDLSGYTRSIGPLECTFDEGVDDAISLTIKQTWLGMANVGVGTLNGIFDNTATSGIHILLQSPTVKRTILVAQGMGAVPANNDPTFMGQFKQGSYTAKPEDNPVTATIKFDKSSALMSNRGYSRPWGVLLHALSAETGANAAIGLDQLAQTTKGGFMCYQVTAAAGSVNMTGAVKVQHADTNSDGSFSDLLSTGTINMVGGGVSGIVALANPTTVKRYVRFQQTFGTATSITYALGWVRGN